MAKKSYYDPEYHRKYYLKHRDKALADAKRRRVEKPEISLRSRLWRDYKLTETDYAHMRQKQNDLCAICHKPETLKRCGKVKTLVIDHNHDTGQVRELLCHRCNSMIAYAFEDSLILRSAADYVEKHYRVE